MSNANTVSIRAPRWEERVVGIAEDQLTTPLVQIEILYVRKTGPDRNKRMFPNPFVMHSDTIRAYPVHFWKGVMLHLIPIKNLHELVIG